MERNDSGSFKSCDLAGERPITSFAISLSRVKSLGVIYSISSSSLRWPGSSELEVIIITCFLNSNFRRLA